MSNKNSNWLCRVSSLDFDPDYKAQNRVWTRIQRPVAQRPASFILVWAGCLLLVVAAGVLTVRALSPISFPSVQTELSEEDCAKLNGRYLLARALAQSEENCPCEEHLTAYDKQTVLQLRQELASVACTVCSAKEQAQLQQCQAKYPSQLKEIKLCKTLC